MQILIDCRCLQAPPPRGGVAVYAEGIVRGLLERHVELTLFANGLVDPRRHLPAFDAPHARWIVGRIPNKLWNITSMFRTPYSVFHIPDVVFLPNLNFLPPLPARTRLVVTVHDLSFEHFPDCFTLKQRLWHRLVRPRQLLHRADAIVAVSETTKQDVVETYGIDPRKVQVVYPGIELPATDDKLRADVRRRYRLPDRFILSLGAIEPRKNLDGLIAAFEQLATRNSVLGTHLVLAGLPGSASRAIARQIARSPARDRIHLLGRVPDHDKRALLALASCFVYPSLWEGFGFPPLEAMTAGVPVVASAAGALPEVLGDAALLVDPLDPAAIADAIRRVLTDAALGAQLIARGRARAARYHWDTAASQLLPILTDS